jgi:GWxTD domain-containing protein
MKNKIFFLILILSLFYSKSFSQSSNSLFDFDYAQFGYDSTSNFIELYYSINQGALSIKNQDTSKYIEGELGILITDSTSGKSIFNKQWLLKYPVYGKLITGEETLVGELKLGTLPEGIYKCKVSLVDQYNKNNLKTINEIFHVKPFAKDQLALSDIQLASKIIPGSKDSSSIFYKNSYEVTPIPTLVFGGEIPVAFYYFELYEKMSGDKNSKLKLNCQIISSRGKIYYNNTQFIEKETGPRDLVGRDVIANYPTDSYSLRITLVDSAESVVRTSLKKFFVYNPGIKVVDTASTQQSAVLASNFGLLSAEECDDIFAKSKYIATHNEMDQYSRLGNVQSKREFLYGFWKKHGEDTPDQTGISYNEYMKRVQESNDRFGHLKTQGWTTDRGRVLIIYGEPSEIDRFPNSMDMKPYEIWLYNDLQGGVSFDFADLYGFSDYLLLNSTARGEYKDDNWQSRITIQ